MAEARIMEYDESHKIEKIEERPDSSSSTYLPLYIK